jgi:hypothetical protein
MLTLSLLNVDFHSSSSATLRSCSWFVSFSFPSNSSPSALTLSSPPYSRRPTTPPTVPLTTAFSRLWVSSKIGKKKSNRVPTFFSRSLPFYDCRASSISRGLLHRFTMPQSKRTPAVERKSSPVLSASPLSLLPFALPPIVLLQTCCPPSAPLCNSPATP